MAEIDDLREIARLFWDEKPIPCPKHPTGMLRGSFVKTTYADHIHLECNVGREWIDIPQRPRQMEFNVPQVEGLVESLDRGDGVKCFRCQANLVVKQDERPGSSPHEYRFTCVRCLSWGVWKSDRSQLAS